ncbi:SAM-dependent methyltransferase [Salegentibacter salarius]|uniref:SAM-dependent methyltransferase n=1 Tax=Salegentibacter salarius TaxID=435906 RepID=A0A2N0TXS4_9FLAO|nr:SAM-dependent methyltransferase [Salegentibacter salarius]OEY73212.1 SAM-dependent methyltransferase [Salegentibacter salarius]PKD19544.1 SAM-dependent methyltransferase [Salegentibacter salarius]SLJ98671.1 16S rRNA (cytidine1402-2'-O)-methyltransferase [Salegentibacter salarius]
MADFRYSGKLYLIPTTMGAANPMQVLPIQVKEIMEDLDIYIAENEKTARRHIKQLLPEKQQSILKFFSLNKFTEATEIPSFLNDCKEGKNVGLLSEAGCPGVADPGAEIVKIAHNEGIQVIPLVGPSSILLAMMGSGMNGQRFTFNGYLPIDKKERKKEIKDLERLSSEKQEAQIFIETPYRNNKLLEDFLQLLHPTTRLCVACDLTLPTEYIVTKPVSEWSKTKTDLHKRPAIFIFQKEI